MPLGQLGPVIAVNQRDVGVDRLVPAFLDPLHRMNDLQLSESIIQMVIAADDMGAAHIHVVDHHGEHVGRCAVGPQEDEIVNFLIADPDPPLHGVFDHGLAAGRGLDTDGERGAFRSL